MNKPTADALAAIQQWMQAAITHPNGVQAGIADLSVGNSLPVEDAILPSSKMTGLERLQIYGRAYFGRLIECLQAQFPAVRTAIGDDAFNAMAFGYLAQNPSTDYSLGAFGQSFDTFLAATRPMPSEKIDSGQPDFADFLIDLAKLEWTYADVFNGKGPETSEQLSASDLTGLTADEFAESRLIPFDCVRLLQFRFPVHEYISALRRETTATIPDARRVNLVVTRRTYIVRRFEVDRQQFQLLRSILDGRTIGDSLQQLCAEPETDIRTLTSDLQKWFRDWTAAPLFAGRIATERSSTTTQTS